MESGRGRGGGSLVGVCLGGLGWGGFSPGFFFFFPPRRARRLLHQPAHRGHATPPPRKPHTSNTTQKTPKTPLRTYVVIYVYMSVVVDHAGAPCLPRVTAPRFHKGRCAGAPTSPAPTRKRNPKRPFYPRNLGKYGRIRIFTAPSALLSPRRPGRGQIGPLWDDAEGWPYSSSPSIFPIREVALRRVQERIHGLAVGNGPGSRSRWPPPATSHVR